MPKVICLSCANVYESSNKRFYVCPECRSKISTVKYNLISSYATDTAMFGVLYRLRFDKQYQDDTNLPKRYCLLTPPEMITFAMIAAISGVIGNASYDLIKMVVQKIRSNYPEPHKDIQTILALIENTQEFENLTKYIQDYYNDFEGVPAVISSAILEEKQVHAVAPMMIKLIGQLKSKNIDYVNKEDITQALSLLSFKAALDEINKQKPKHSSFKNMWNKVSNIDLPPS